MQIILLERIEKLGQMGDHVNVKPGYARNYLLPQGKALRANKASMERFESERAQREADNLTKRSEAKTEADKMDGLAVNMVRAASEMGQLFGSVTSRDIAEAVSDSGFTIGRDQVIMDRAIKTLGLTKTRIRLHPEVSIFVIVNIARSLAEAETQLKTGVAVTGDISAENNADDRQTTSEAKHPENVVAGSDSSVNDSPAIANETADDNL
jgi:large subunit ribosomal protein L9